MACPVTVGVLIYTSAYKVCAASHLRHIFSWFGEERSLYLIDGSFEMANQHHLWPVT